MIKALFFQRCLASTNENNTCVRRDPIRKLDLLESIAQLKTSTAAPFLEKGAAAGVLYAFGDIDSVNAEQLYKGLENGRN